MIGKYAFAYWSIEFVCITGVAIVLSVSSVNNTWILVPAIALIFAKVFQYRAFVRQRHLRVEEQLDILRVLLPNKGTDLRCTYHIPVKPIWGPRKLLQTFDYLPNGGGGLRQFPINKGIIGKTYQHKAPIVENFRTDEEYRNQMMLRYNYTQEELAQRTADRKSYLCYPLLDANHKVLGLLYFDSNQPGTFRLDEKDPTWQMIRTASQIICAHLI